MRRLIPIIAAGFIAASLLTWAFGDSGLRATARLSRYRQSLAANVESLRERNAALTADLKRLREDPEANELLARELGLYRSGDRVLRIEGLPARRHLYTVGSLLRQKRSDRLRESLARPGGHRRLDPPRRGIGCAAPARGKGHAQARGRAAHRVDLRRSRRVGA